MLDFVPERKLLSLVKSIDSSDIIAIGLGSLGDKSALAQEWDFVLKSFLLGESLDIAHQLVVRNSTEGILNPISKQVSAIDPDS